MSTISEPISGMTSIQSAKQAIQAGNVPVSLWGITGTVRPLIMDILQGDAAQVLVVTWDDARADQLYQDYRFCRKEVYRYPAKDVLFYNADVHGNLATRKRMEIIQRLKDGQPSVIILTAEGLMDRIPRPEIMQAYTLHLAVEEEMDLQETGRRLLEMGYESVPFVEMAGQFSTRGGVMDIFPLTEECPVRIELWGDEIISVRAFDATSQRSIEDLKEIEIPPATEYVLDDARREKGLHKIDEELKQIASVFEKAGRTEQRQRLMDAVRSMKDGLRDFAGNSNIDSLVNYFFEDTVSFLDYLPENTRIYVEEPVKIRERAGGYFENFRLAMQSRLEGGYILPGQADILFSDEDILGRIAKRASVYISEFQLPGTVRVKTAEEFVCHAVTAYGGRTEDMILDMKKYREEGYSILVYTMSKTRAENLAQHISDNDVPAFFSMDQERLLQPREVMVTKGGLEKGFVLPEVKLVVLTESEIYRKNRIQTRRRSRRLAGSESITDLRELHVGDYVVHEQHGIGIYKGIEQVEMKGRYKDYINIDYAGGGRLFIPVDQLSMIGKIADRTADPPKLNKLGGTEWERTKRRVRNQVDDIADELIKLYADRMDQQGYEYPPDDILQTEFEETFPYEETQDQLKAIEDVKRDMESTKIMDRLICGDVGFGKTEVAIRAAFKCVMSGRQVVYLVPTTILAQQHYETFVNRLKEYPMRIRMLSRFATPKEAKEAVMGLADGSVDIVIGTHKLLGKDVRFKNLGLLIIDEEQRFGVKHKEKIKQLKKSVDVLTLTATPIPRTLHMSLAGIRDMSLLREPPVDRRPIQTYVMEYDEEMVKEACNRELARGGQVYYVYNRVNDIESVTARLEELLPDARIAYAHGQMSSRELEKLMHSFIEREIDILVTTTIIETGLDIPNVNTIIIHGADRFGLSQLYQLRGRVGRSGRSAYAFMMYQKNKILKEEAEQRLAAIREFTELGSGYKISMKDLEIRGAGDVLGSSQSGHMMEVGYDLFVKMLSEAIRERQGIEVDAVEEKDPSIDIPIDAYIPDVYVRSEYLKLELYKRIYKIRKPEDAELIEEELKDRFGPIPREVVRLLRVVLLKRLAAKACINEIKYMDNDVYYFIDNGTAVRVDQIPVLLKKFRGMRLYTAKRSGFIRRHSITLQDELLDSVVKEVRGIYDLLIPKSAEQNVTGE